MPRKLARTGPSGSGRTCTGPVNRRQLLQIGALGLGGLSFPQFAAARAAAGNSRAETSVIMLYQHGGPSQLETYDLKPEAPSEYRSIYQPIPTKVPGMEICERFPLQAKLADKFSLIRSLHHDVGIHSDGGIIVLTGKRPTKLDPTSQSKSEHPDYGSITSRQQGMSDSGMPPYVAIPKRLYMTQPTYLGMHHGPFEAGEPSAEKYQSPISGMSAGQDEARFAGRRTLLEQFDRFRRDLDLSGTLEGNDRFRDLAMEMLTGPNIAKAFEIQQEKDELRDRYGRNIWGQSCLLARRLAEAGTSVINIYFDTPKTGQEFTNWDDHILNAGRPGHFGKYLDVRLPYMDQALSTLIEDIHERGLNRNILVVVVGEFGRTPRLAHNTNGTGRDHWPQAYSALVSGGDLRMGQVVGATNSKAEYPAECPLTPQDLLATIYRHLGINPDASLVDHAGRPVPILPHGKPISELI